ncbi:hypothetical protein D3C87_2004430 [compost metagenome]
MTVCRDVGAENFNLNELTVRFERDIPEGSAGDFDRVDGIGDDGLTQPQIVCRQPIKGNVSCWTDIMSVCLR